MVEELVLAALTGSPPATTAGDNVWRAPAPDDTGYPLVTFERISSFPTYSLAGSSGNDRCRIQVDCWAIHYAQAKQIAEEVRVAMEAAPFKGILVTDFDEFDEDAKVYRVTSDFHVRQKE